MKIQVFIQGFENPSSRYRVLQYIPYLEKAHIKMTVQEYPKNLIGWFKSLRGLKDKDIVFFQRKKAPFLILFLLKSLKKRIVFDFDDAIMFRDSFHRTPYSFKRRLSFKKMVKFSDLVLAGNQFLKNEAEKYTKKVVLMPLSIDLERYRPKPFIEKRVISLGWIGSKSTIHYLAHYKPVWEQIGKKYKDVELLIISDAFIEAENIKIKKINWNYESEIEDLQKIDIGLMPLFFDLWSLGKGGLKILQYSGVGIPSVCTPVGMNKEIVEDGITGFFASTFKEWVDRLSLLIEDKELRRRLGEAAREKVMKEYNLRIQAERLIELLLSLKD